MNNVFSAQDNTQRVSLNNYISGALIRNIAGTLQDSLIVHFGRTILLARWRRGSKKLLRIQPAPVHLCAGKGPVSTFNTGGALDDLHPGARIHQPPYEAEVAPGHGLSRPQPDYEALHGLLGYLVEFDQLLQLVASGHRMAGLSILRPEDLLR